MYYPVSGSRGLQTFWLAHPPEDFVKLHAPLTHLQSLSKILFCLISCEGYILELIVNIDFKK